MLRHLTFHHFNGSEYHACLSETYLEIFQQAKEKGIFFYSTRDDDTAKWLNIRKRPDGLYMNLDASLLVVTDVNGKILSFYQDVDLSDIPKILY